MCLLDRIESKIKSFSFCKFLHEIGFKYDKSKGSPPPPAKKKRIRTTYVDDRTIIRHGKKFVTDGEVEGYDIAYKDQSGNMGKGKNKPERTLEFDEFDTAVLHFEEFCNLDVDLYKVIKEVWSEHISNAKADKDYRIQKIKKFKFTTRKPYFKAVTAAYKIRHEPIDEK